MREGVLDRGGRNKDGDCDQDIDQISLFPGGVERIAVGLFSLLRAVAFRLALFAPRPAVFDLLGGGCLLIFFAFFGRAGILADGAFTGRPGGDRRIRAFNRSGRIGRLGFVGRFGGLRQVVGSGIL